MFSSLLKTSVAKGSEEGDAGMIYEFVLPNAVLPKRTTGPSCPKVLNSVIDAQEVREISPTADKTAKPKKKRICRIFQAAWKAIKRPFSPFCKKNKVTPFVHPLQPDGESQKPEIKADAILTNPRLEAVTKPDEPKLPAGAVPLLKTGIYPMMLELSGGVSSKKTDHADPMLAGETKTDTSPAVPSPKAGADASNPMMMAAKISEAKTDAIPKPKAGADASNLMMMAAKISEAKTDTSPAIPKPKAGADASNPMMMAAKISEAKTDTSPVIPKPKASADAANPMMMAAKISEAKTDTSPAIPKPKAGADASNPMMMAAKISEAKTDTSPAIPKPKAGAANPMMMAAKIPKSKTDTSPAIPKPKAGAANPMMMAAKIPKSKPDTSPAIPKPKAGAANPMMMAAKISEAKTDTSPAIPKPKASADASNPMMMAAKIPKSKTYTSPAIPKLKAGADASNPMMMAAKIPKSKTGISLSAKIHKAKTDTNLATSSPKAGADDSIPKLKTSSNDTIQLMDNKNLVPVLDEYVYDISKKLGRGCFGRVYEGFRKSDGKKVAVKVVKRQKDDKHVTIHGSSTRLPLEVGLLHILQKPPISPNVIQMYAWCQDSKTLTIVMEYFHPCETLGSFIHSRGKLKESEAHHLWVQVVRAVEHCLKRGVFHTDLHPGNILVNTDSLELKVVDFGIGKIVNNLGYSTRYYAGCLPYRPPEVYLRMTYQTMPTSVWFLGCLLFHMVHGSPPFKGCPSQETFRIYNKSISQELSDLLSKCLQMSQNTRLTIKGIIRHPWFSTFE